MKFLIVVILLSLSSCKLEILSKQENFDRTIKDLYYSKDKYGICYAGIPASTIGFTTVPCDKVGL